MESNGTASYNALQVKVRKSVGKHWSMTAFYTCSKSLSSEEMDGASTSGGAQDSNNLALERGGRSDYDQRHNVVTAMLTSASSATSRFARNTE
jgi:hypothetical protein